MSVARSDLPALPWDCVLSRDRGRLLRLRSACERAPDNATARSAYEQALAVSLASYRQRASQVPTVLLGPPDESSLPVAREAEHIIALIRAHPVVVIAGETGSGKTTQLPKLCLAAGRGVAGLIGCTQPRRIAARAVAHRVAEELGVPLGGAVGYQVRFTEKVGIDSHIKFMTDGILLAEIQSDRWLSAYDTIIIDEAHERSLNIDFLLGYLKELLKKRRDLKVIVTSATIDTGRFAKHFADAPVVSVEGRSYPVETRYRPLGDAPGSGDDSDACESAISVNDAIVAAVDEATREDPLGDVLVFLPGEREIRDAHAALSRRKYRATEVIPLYARLSVRDQDRVFNPGPGRRIVLATNVAETSLTVPRIRYVIDPGMARVKRYSPRGKLDRLHIEPISQASADQRKGRCGRIAAGVCFRLYSEADFQSRTRYTDPEILRASLAGVILRMLSLGLGRVEDFPFIDPPDSRAISDGWQSLAELGAVDSERRLTPIGRQMARLPVDVKLARMLVAANGLGCLRELIAIASFLGIQDPRERPADAREAADRAHALFADSQSEFVGVLKLWEGYRIAHEELTQSKLRGWCEKHFLGFLRMREWRELHRQLLLTCEELGWAVASGPCMTDFQPAHYGQLHRALIAGLPSQIGHKSEKGLYDAPRQRKFQLFPGSMLAGKNPGAPQAKEGRQGSPAWLLVATLLDTQKVWGLMAARIEPDWVIAELGHLLARKHFDPHWSRAQGRVIGYEQISLFGLLLAAKKPVQYGNLYPAEARELFVRQALLTGEINSKAGFIARNLATLEVAREEEAKLRRAGLVADDDWQARWYLDRLPPEVHNVVALDKWFGKLAPAQRRALEWTLADLLPGEGSEQERFPKYFALGDVRLALHYHFEPGHPEDGVTLDVPLHLLKAVDAVRLGWLVPGLIQEKAASMIRSLPKTLRRNYVPAPDFARAFAEAYPQPEADSLPSTLARFLARATGAPVSALDFDESAVEPHLRMNLRLASSEKGVLAMSRDIETLRREFGERAEQAFAQRAGERLTQSGLTRFPDEAIPFEIPGAAGVPAYPALRDDGDSVSLHVLSESSQARVMHDAGVRRLATLALVDKAKQARKQLPVQPKLGLLYAAIEGFTHSPHATGATVPAVDQLRVDLVTAALAALLAEDLSEIRDRPAFERLVDDAGKQLFAQAMQRLALAEDILAKVADIKPRLTSKLMGWASGNLDDLSARLADLVPPGFLRDTPAGALAELPRYLNALALRTERALRDPQRDQARMLELRVFDDALLRAKQAGVSTEPAWQQFRWDLEELRVSVFAQELGARRQVSAKRLARQLEVLT